MRLLRSLAGRRGRLEQCVDIAMSVEGQVSRAEVGTLIELARNTAPGTAIVEIGTFRGRSTTALALRSVLGARNRGVAVGPHEELTRVLAGGLGPRGRAARKVYRGLRGPLRPRRSSRVVPEYCSNWHRRPGRSRQPAIQGRRPFVDG